MFIFLSIAESVLSTHLYLRGDVDRMRLARRLDIGSVLLLGGIYAALSIWIIAYWGHG